jgi:hypothetical protein
MDHSQDTGENLILSLLGQRQKTKLSSALAKIQHKTLTIFWHYYNMGKNPVFCCGTYGGEWNDEHLNGMVKEYWKIWMEMKVWKN